MAHPQTWTIQTTPLYSLNNERGIVQESPVLARDRK